MKCYNCGYVGDSLDFLSTAPIEWTDGVSIDDKFGTIEGPTPFKVCPKCKKVQ